MRSSVSSGASCTPASCRADALFELIQDALRLLGPLLLGLALLSVRNRVKR